ncbi:MAG TPA: hypothetical protein VK841_19960 [Polyangiaceae bacterium]|jgi:hypothetical protein|nr:hypothetical protein [Polyangiaceae bacterium]
MDSDADLRAYDALAEHPRLADLAAVTRTVMAEIARDRTASGRSARVADLAAERELRREDAETPFGNALDAVERDPEDDAQRALVRALSAHAVAANVPTDREAEDRTAADLLWLATRTPFDATGLLDRALGDGAATLWDAIAEQVRRVDRGAQAALGRGEAFVGAAALAASTAPAAMKLAGSLATDVRDKQLAYVLQACVGAGEGGDGVEGELASRPRSAFVGWLLAATGIALSKRAVRGAARLVLAYKTPARVSLSGDGGIRVRWRTELLGRTLREDDVLVPRAALVRASRDVRYPALALYVGLFALALGSYVGISALFDGIYASSPSLLATGIAVVGIGVAADFVFSSLIPGQRGRCRIVFVPRKGPALCVSAVDIALADELLGRLSRR